MENVSTQTKKIRVLIVEDCNVTVQLLISLMINEEDIDIVGIAKDGDTAIKMAERLKPDLITLDIILPKKNGLEVTQHIMAYMPTPILVITSSSQFNEIDLSFNAISLGALDLIEKDNMKSNPKFQIKLLEKIRLLSKIKVIHHPISNKKKIVLQNNRKENQIFIVGIATSTGGPKALYPLLANLPKTFDFSIIIIQHIVPSFCASFVEWLKSKTKRKVSLAKSMQIPEPNNIYIAPANNHLKITSDGKMFIYEDSPYKKYKPSANIFFTSLAKNYSHSSMGVILSGMGDDGLEGLKLMYEKNIPIIAQNEQSCIVYGMPKVCIDAGIVDSIMAPESLSHEILFFYSKWKG